MSHHCGFCDKIMDMVDHTNNELFDIYLCERCTGTGFYTQYRQVCYKGNQEVLATTIRIDEYYVVINHCFNLVSSRNNYTRIHIGITKIFELDFVLQLPLHDLALAKRKLQIYTTFS